MDLVHAKPTERAFQHNPAVASDMASKIIFTPSKLWTDYNYPFIPILLSFA